MKKLLYLSLALTLVLILCACVGSTPSDSNPLSGHTHSFGQWKVVTESTCAESGLKQRACECGEVEEEEIPALEHTPEVDEAVAPTCDDPGSTEGTHCSVCNKVLLAQETIEATGHDYDKEHICTVCNAHEFILFALNDDEQSYRVQGLHTSTDTLIIPAQYKGLPVTDIGEAAFYGNSSLTSVTIPSSITCIGVDAFGYCPKLASVRIEDLSAWCAVTFHNAYSNPLRYANDLYVNGELATDIRIPDSVTSIGSWAFYGCGTIESITVPNSVATIGTHAFADCQNLVRITLPDSITSIGERAFTGTGYFESESNRTDGVLYIGNHLIHAKAELSGDYTVKDGTKCIAAAAFYDCVELTGITLPDSVTGIGDGAFSGCTGLSNVTFGNGLTSIGTNAFRQCVALTSVTLPNSVTSIGDSAFYVCDALASITIPNSVTSIGDSAFVGCIGLTSIRYTGTTEQWNAIVKGSAWDDHTDEYTVFCTDGDISE